jgi:secreted trypsin-like serine protease
MLRTAGWLRSLIVSAFAVALGVIGPAGSVSAAPVPPPVALVVGGNDAPAGAYPYQVSVQIRSGNSWYHICGGSIIGERWVLTAAHCLNKTSVDLMRVSVGANTLTPGGTVYPVMAQISHEGYDANAPAVPHDIGLLKLSTSITYTPLVQPIALPNLPYLADGKATLTGWGLLSGGGSSPANALQHATVTVLPMADCRVRWPGFGLDPVNQLCTFDREPPLAPCEGDSGGPLAREGQVIGIVSWGVKTCSGKYPSVYTNVGAYRTWITGWTGI